MTHVEKIEAAGAQFLKLAESWPEGFAVIDQIFAGEGDRDLPEVAVIFAADTAQQEDPIGTGNCWTLCQCYVESTDTEDPQTEATRLELHQAVATALEQLLLRADLPARLSEATPDFHCFGAQEFTPLAVRLDDAWINGYQFRIYSCPKALT